ncbi:alpha-N-acetyl-neuraminyl-2,3-beta-galactosyl-1,3-N-acetyl-galactosaminide alpha-2,6-sialyltransferase-like [Lytechinus pictus]|uniref:alpha-N-acetyl-neuraminyl-2,3-beta-galactosyl-1, 3-N-acetyl-galactosaminide alpha-2,6-sialyltransferase-like n=1 Tax=Lytechinus pictus TaxID=7653 RepID=UPI00240D922A|nr:alpha-N-acetyl-neuraminyl-2,3-beta-galactosyl-1,3-N-acetyl-galactosaminide alpha-2,6-sialyltransferase-like [Lytechinus pictus]
MIAISVSFLYTLRDTRHHSQDDTGTKSKRSRFYNSLFPFIRNDVADYPTLTQHHVADDKVVPPHVGATGGEGPVKNDAIDSGKQVQQLILRNSGGIAGESGNMIGEIMHEEEQRTFELVEEEEAEEEEIEVLNDFHEIDIKNKNTGDDPRVPVTSTIDVTSVHFVNATVKPTPPPEVEGYFNIQTNQKLRMRCSQCALVSSSGHLTNTSAGAEIDSYPCVLRMNSAPVRGYENDVGKRTTIRIMGHVNLKVLNASNELQDEILINASTRAEKIMVPWLYNVKVNEHSDMYYKSARNLSRLYPHVEFYLLTPDKMKIAESLFKTETGLTRQEARTWLSTGWMSMLYAVDVCDKVDIFGLVPENYCTKNPNSSIPYHYYELDGLKECDYYTTSEEHLTYGHKFITEKAVFARWATKFNMEFHLPAWNLTALARNNSIETPFLKRFYEAKRSGTLPKTSNGSRVIRRIVKRVVKKVIIRRKVPVVQKKAIPKT